MLGCNVSIGSKGVTGRKIFEQGDCSLHDVEDFFEVVMPPESAVAERDAPMEVLFAFVEIGVEVGEFHGICPK